MMLARIKTLKWQIDCLNETLSGMEERNWENNTSEGFQVEEELQSECNDLQMDLAEERNRLIRLRGYDENGIPF